MSFRFRSEEYTALEIWIVTESRTGKTGSLTLVRIDSPDFAPVTVPAGKVRHERRRIELAAGGLYELTLSGCAVSLAYLTDCPDLMEQGIQFLKISDLGVEQVKDLVMLYDVADREQYHFGPLTGWMNDPNGLCYFRGFYHMFYQFNPNDEVWGPMYWGHAVSRDLVHWTHLPVVFAPQQEILEDETLTGGAFSGSAVVDGDVMRLFFTRDIRHNDDDAVEYQVTCTSSDGFSFSEEKIFFEKPRDIRSRNFRDPKGEKRGNDFHIALGTVEEYPEILHAVTSFSGKETQEQTSGKEVSEIRRLNPFIVEKTPGITTFECPDVFSLDGRTVAAAAWMDYKDPQGRINPIVWYVGDECEDGSIEVEMKGMMDFGTNFYAVQSFEYAGRRIAIGWINDLYCEHVRRPGSVNGSQSIPRELHVRGGKLLQTPVKEIYALMSERYYDGPGERLEFSPKNGSYYVKLDFARETRYDLVLARSPQGELTLRGDGKRVVIGTKGTASEHIAFETEVDSVRNLEIFVDRRVVEVFVNDGERAGAKLFYSASRNGCFVSRFLDEGAVHMTVRAMKGIW